MTVHMTFADAPDVELAKPPLAAQPAMARAVSIVDPLALTPEKARAWDDLAVCASEANPFAERWCLQPALHLLDPQHNARLVMVQGDGGALIGVMALAKAQKYGPMPLHHVTGWVHPNQFHGAPLVRSGCEAEFWRCLLDWCDNQRWARTLLHLTHLTEGGPLHRALAMVAAERDAPVQTVHREVRAMLASDLAPDAYWDAAMRGKKRKELRRQANRLGEEAPISWHRWDLREDVQPWIDAFLTLEAGGWKGAAGSALASRSDTDAWFRSIIAGAVTAGRLDMRMMRLGGRPLAMLINFLCLPGGFSFKTAFDEDYARFSPGVLLQQQNLDLLTHPGLEWVDSCAQQDHSMIDSIWQERRALVWVNIPLRGRFNRLRFAALMRLESIWRRLKARNNPSEKEIPV